MSEFCFLLFRGKLSKHRERAIDEALAAAYEAGDIASLVRVIPHHDPSQGHRGWFTGPNLGAPFDDNLRQDAERVLRQAGLWPPVPGRS